MKARTFIRFPDVVRHAHGAICRVQRESEHSGSPAQFLVGLPDCANSAVAARRTVARGQLGWHVRHERSWRLDTNTPAVATFDQQASRVTGTLTR